MSNITPSDLERANARSKSYITAAVLTLILYFLLWIPGLIANIMYLTEARRMQGIAGQSLPGVGCLWILLLLNVVLPLVLVCLVAAMTLATRPGTL